MKKITLGFSILAAAGIFVAGCNKKVTAAPVADTEFQSTIDATYAASIITDIDMICGFLGEGAYPKFVSPVAGSQGTITVLNNTTTPQSASITFGDPTHPVSCLDGKTRTGSIVMTYSFTDINSNYYRDYGFIGNIGLNSYVVDGYSVDDSVSTHVGQIALKNLAASANPNPAAVKLKWSINGYINIRNIADPTKNMAWVGSLNKTLANTAQLAPNNTTAITWTAAIVNYDGSFHGFTPGNVPYTYTISTATPLVKNYTCSPDKVIGVSTTPSITPVNSEFHPFIGGITSFTTSTKEPRAIDYGLSGGTPCDNSGSITIKGISYNVDFKK